MPSTLTRPYFGNCFKLSSVRPCDASSTGMRRRVPQYKHRQQHMSAAGPPPTAHELLAMDRQPRQLERLRTPDVDDGPEAFDESDEVLRVPLLQVASHAEPSGRVEAASSHAAATQVTLSSSPAGGTTTSTTSAPSSLWGWWARRQKVPPDARQAAVQRGQGHDRQPARAPVQAVLPGSRYSLGRQGSAAMLERMSDEDAVGYWHEMRPILMLWLGLSAISLLLFLIMDMGLWFLLMAEVADVLAALPPLYYLAAIGPEGVTASAAAVLRLNSMVRYLGTTAAMLDAANMAWVVVKLVQTPCPPPSPPEERTGPTGARQPCEGSLQHVLFFCLLLGGHAILCMHMSQSAHAARALPLPQPTTTGGRGAGRGLPQRF